MEEVKFKVKNMECKSCANAIEKKLKSMTGVNAVDIDLQNKIIKIQHDNPNLCQDDLTCARGRHGVQGAGNIDGSHANAIEIDERQACTLYISI